MEAYIDLHFSLWHHFLNCSRISSCHVWYKIEAFTLYFLQPVIKDYYLVERYILFACFRIILLTTKKN